MYVTDELIEQQKKIFAYMNFAEKLKIKLFYERNKKFQSEYEQNENEISIIKTEIKLNKVMATLDYLMSEHNDSIQFYISLSNKEKE
tara:strand:+ start:142 stop:402 length:261 start_codon:yes stop_codon:yes gene_type:complete